MSSIKFNKRELVTIWKALKYRNEHFNSISEDQFYEENNEKESKDIDKLLKKITPITINFMNKKFNKLLKKVEEKICTQIAK